MSSSSGLLRSRSIAQPAAAATAAQINVVTTPRSSTRTVAKRFWITIAPYEAALAPPGRAEQEADPRHHRQGRIGTLFQRVLDRIPERVGNVAERVHGLP